MAEIFFMKTLHFPFKILALALVIGLILPVLIMEGMFMDGMLYTCVAKNLGNGIGTFWFPISYETWNIGGFTTFHEHPPLVFGIQALFFSVLGNSMYVERFYSFLTACITAYLIVLTWKELFKNDERFKAYSWLPVILWVIVPVAHWSFQNNMQENTMGLFSFSAVIILLKSYNKEKWQFLYVMIAGGLVFLASLSKGVPGIFPIGLLGLHWLLFRKISFIKTVFYTLILIAVPVLIYVLVLQNPDAMKALSFYFYERLLGRTETAHTVTNRFHTFVGLFSHLLPSLLITAILIFVFLKKKIEGLWSEKKNYLLFLFIGFSASLPLMLTMVQKDFYFSHSIPFFAICLSLILIPGLDKLIKRIKIENKGFKIFKVCTIALLVFAIGLTINNVGGTSRDEGDLADVYAMGKVIPARSVVKSSPELAQDWGLILYFSRYFSISLTSQDYPHTYYIARKEDKKVDLNKYEKVNLDTRDNYLYKLKE